MPKKALTQFGGWVAGTPMGVITTAIIADFVRRYDVNMMEAAEPSLGSYATFNAFFTRALREGARPIADSAWVSPVDGAVSQLGPIADGQIFQAKGHQYTAQALLACDADAAQVFHQGQFATIYLSPKDYHRIHMPCAGTLTRMTYVPGDLFSVSPLTAAHVPGLFARNERVVCWFDTDTGPMVMVLVGATIVGSMSTVWHGRVNPPRTKAMRHWTYAVGDVRLAKGAEMGRFLLGSTVVVLWPERTVTFDPTWVPGGAVRLGEAMASASASVAD
jgi:phosphatidylserine decarboxylase